ncbi:MAG: protein CrcB-like protein [Actinomyces sp.]|nr:protein CrcB-like protein [Actinomyces sp.]
MTDTRDPRGIVNFFVRYLVLHVIFLVGLALSYAAGLAIIYFFGFMGFFTFFQVLIAITRKFLDKAGSWKPVAIAGAVFSDVAVLWWLGTLDSSSEWWLVTAWLPYHFVAAFFAWGLREIFHWLAPRDAATPAAPASPVETATSENPNGPEDANAPTAAPASAEVDTDKQ